MSKFIWLTGLCVNPAGGMPPVFAVRIDSISMIDFDDPSIITDGRRVSVEQASIAALLNHLEIVNQKPSPQPVPERTLVTSPH